ncbi:uncharacterized protein Fot_26074 [Forsythia ovata]|uniref:Uncharacterized protein n=1 Tax=Forsythia ovata TaxID=205694 RepID=A0ABD1UAV3_9LAMI
MESINVLVYYDGVWDHARGFNGYSIVGIIVPFECSYAKFVDIIMKELKMDQLQYAIKIQYQVMANGILIEICSNSSVYFYIQIKKTESGLTKLPLCVEIEKVVCNEENLICLGNVVNGEDTSVHSQAIRTHNSSYDFGSSSLPILPITEEMGAAICEYVPFPEQNIDENECDVISRPSVKNVKQNAIFRTKELLAKLEDLVVARNMVTIE